MNIELRINNKELFDFLKNNKSIELDLIDKLNKYFITVNYNGNKLDIPFKYILINTNKKLKGIPYLNFEIDCTSAKIGYCQYSKYCYSKRDQKLFKNNNYKIILNVLFIKEVQKNSVLFKLVTEFLNHYQLIRFNCNNDLSNKKDIQFLIELANNLKSSVISGYTNRYDILGSKKDIEKYQIPKNLIFNGSNYLLDNNYYVTTNLKEYLASSYYCIGSCSNCLKCFKKSNKTIYCLLHGSLNTIDSAFNTQYNRKYLIFLFNNQFKELHLKDYQLTTNKGLLSSLNKALSKNKTTRHLKFKNYTELTTYLRTIKGSA